MSDENESQTTAEDDWGAAMAEQEQTEAEAAALAPKPATATVFKDFAGGDLKTGTHNDIDFILDIPVQLTVELGRTKIAIKNLLQLAQGSVVELDGLAGEPNDKFGIRLTDIITPSERIRKLNR